MTMRRFLCAGLISALALTSVARLGAQTDPRQILNGVILQGQTGRPNPLWYGQELWQTIAIQTGNTGYYPQLAQLGLVQNIVVTQQLPLPAGILYAMSVRLQYGVSHWVIGISSLTNRIEYASFVYGPNSVPFQLPGVQAQAPAPATPQSAPSVDGPAANPDRPAGGKPGAAKPEAPAAQAPSAATSEACKKFPNMCTGKE
jgi:hypothetical protein